MPTTTFRHQLTSNDVKAIVDQHLNFYASEYAFDQSFEPYVKEPLDRFLEQIETQGNRIWLAEQGSTLVGTIAIVHISRRTAQLRWFLVDPKMQGGGLGRQLLESSIAFCRDMAYQEVFLWTIDALPAAAHLYRSAGFEPVEEIRHPMWGVEVNEQRYCLRLEGSESGR